MTAPEPERSRREARGASKEARQGPGRAGDLIFTVALIALSRKIIILEPEKYDALSLIGIGLLILGLVSGYWVTVSLARQR